MAYTLKHFDSDDLLVAYLNREQIRPEDVISVNYTGERFLGWTLIYREGIKMDISGSVIVVFNGTMYFFDNDVNLDGCLERCCVKRSDTDLDNGVYYADEIPDSTKRG